MEKSLRQLAAGALIWKFLDNVGVKAIFLARLLVMASLLSPEDFGLLAIGVTAVTVFMTLSNFGIAPALIQQPNVSDRDYQTGWTIGIVRAALVTIVVFVSAPWIADFFGDPRAAQITQVLVVGVLIDACNSAKVATLNRELQFRSLASLHLANAITSTGVAIALASSYGVWAMVFGSLAGSCVTAVCSYVAAPFRPRLSWDKPSAIGLLNFGRWIFFTGVIAMVASAGLRAIISRKIGIAELGIFFLSVRLAYLPAQAVVGVIEPVAFPLYARLREFPQQARKVYRSTLLGMVALLVPSCMLLMAITPGLVEHILGPKWSGTTFAIQVLTLSTLIGLVGDASMPLLKGFGDPSKETKLEVLQTVVSLSVAFAIATQFGLAGIVAALLIATLVTQPGCVIYVKRVIDLPFAELLRPISVITGGSIVGAVIALWLDHATTSFAGFILAAITGAIAVYGIIWLLDRHLQLGVATMLEKQFPIIGRVTRAGENH